MAIVAVAVVVIVVVVVAAVVVVAVVVVAAIVVAAVNFTIAIFGGMAISLSYFCRPLTLRRRRDSNPGRLDEKLKRFLFEPCHIVLFLFSLEVCGISLDRKTWV